MDMYVCMLDYGIGLILSNSITYNHKVLSTRVASSPILHIIDTFLRDLSYPDSP